MSKNDKKLKKLIEAAEKSLQENKQARFDSKQEPVAEKQPESIEEYSKGEWEKWGAKHLIDKDAKKPGSLAGTLIVIAVILAAAVFAVFHFQLYKQDQETTTSKTGTLLKQLNQSKPVMNPGSGPAGFSGENGVITHKGIPSATRPSSYKQPRQRVRSTGTPLPEPTPRWMKENPPPASPGPGEDPIFLQ
ncbi:MAG: hypothetical protein LWY06_03995 [Firmicutes bacterium]|nr:hypothetical protein [Bacillota bacterium]